MMISTIAETSHISTLIVIPPKLELSKDTNEVIFQDNVTYLVIHNWLIRSLVQKQYKRNKQFHTNYGLSCANIKCRSIPHS